MADHMGREMAETAAVARRLVEAPRAEEALRVVGARRYGSIVFVGCGSSYFAGITGAYAVDALLGKMAVAISALDFAHYRSGGVGPDTLVFALSQSGETFETLQAARTARERGATVIAVTNGPESTLPGLAEASIPLLAGEEYGPGTKTVVAETLALYAFLVEWAGESESIAPEKRAALRRELQAAPALVQHVQEQAAARREIAERLAGQRTIAVVGSGPHSALAYQVANVLKETTKIHTEGFEAIEFRHGPLEMIGKDAAVISLGTHASPIHEHLRAVCQIARRAGALWVAVTDEEDHRIPAEADLAFTHSGMSELMASIVTLSAFHQWAHEMATLRGLDPNAFGNIVKTWRDGSV
ncbi:SIS domain-containing protein [Limnochorda pilosa]|uniref:Glutamine--fructose-6-phosphate aminotransferase [isomerizing] n=1 Tax=Limnochorda pilosa TaxID=1555112 RepID=A0A0K2SM28_LIMPI|nr:SIS domain-containing protein [Limnochorda pilosa]BAS28168.1 hypothetical protein LIP_2327 [Limnochorda pilosa]